MYRRLIVVFVISLRAAAAQQWSIGFWTQFGTPLPVSKIRWSGLTHVVQSLGLVNSDGTLDLNTYNVAANAPGLVAAARTANVKPILGITQPWWLGKPPTLQRAASTWRDVLVNNIMTVLDNYGLP
jgi:hypothetical protein